MSETLIVIFVIIMATAFCLILFFFLSSPARKKYTFLRIFRRDPNHQVIHIFGARTVMPEDGDSFNIWHYRLLDLKDFTIYEGESQKGEDFSLKSPFAERALSQMSKLLRKDFSFFEAGEEDEESEELPSGAACPVKVQKGKNVTETEVQKQPPPDSLIFTDLGDDPPRFKVELRRSGRSVVVHHMKGKSDYFFKKIWIPERNAILFTYRKGGWAGGGMGMCMINVQNGQIIFDQYIVPSKKQPS